MRGPGREHACCEACAKDPQCRRFTATPAGCALFNQGEDIEKATFHGSYSGII